MQQLSDSELMALVKDGDLLAFDELYHRYEHRIRSFLFSLTWDQDTAEDYLQEVFVRLYRARDRYEPTGRFSAYLFRIAKNYYLSECRKKRAAGQQVSLSHATSDGRAPFENIRASEGVEPEARLMAEYRRFRIRRAIQALPERRKLVFVMSHFQDMKYSEIAEVLNIPIGTVKSRMFAAVNTLRSLLKEELP